MSHILMIVTAADSLTLADGTEHPTGFWAEELVVAHRTLVTAGHSIIIATPGGKPAPVDPGSLTVDAVGSQEKATDLVQYLASIADDLEHPAPVGDIDAADFDAVVIPGGHGPMTDLAHDAAVGALLLAADRAGTIIAPFCHGPAALLSAQHADGTFVFAGRHLTAFTDDEERVGGLGDNTPWLVASRLAERGAVVEPGEPWSSHVVRDKNVISGQNPQSSEAVAAAVIMALAE